MPTTYDALNTARQAAGGLRAPGKYNGAVLCLSDSFTFDGDVFAAADFIKIGVLPAGARVLDAGFTSPDLGGSTGTFTLGTVADPDGYLGTVDPGGQAAGLMASTGALIGTQVVVDTDVILDCSEATDDADGLTLHAWVLYVMESF